MRVHQAISDNVGVKKGTVANGDSSDDLKPTLSGMLSAALAAGETLGIFFGKSFLGNASVSGKTWSFTPSKKLATNLSKSFKARVADVAGNLSRACDARRLILDQIKPTLSISDNFQ